MSHNINMIFFSVDTTSKTFYLQMIEGFKRSMSQNKDIYKAIYEIKTSQDAYQKEMIEKMDNLSEKVNQLITPEDSYWKVNMIVAKYHFYTKIYSVLL